MNLLPMSAPIRRALTVDELTAIIARVTAAEDITQLLPIVVVATSAPTSCSSGTCA